MQLAVFTKNRTNPAYFAARLGADRAAAVFGDHTTHYVPERPDDPEQQSTLIDAALATRPDAFVLSPVHPEACNAAITRIRDAGIPIFAFVNPIDCVPMAGYVGADDTQLAIKVADYLLHHLRGQRRVLLVGGHAHSVTSLARMRGFESVVRAAPGVRIVGRLHGDYQRDVARAAVAAWLRDHPARVEGVLVANDIMALGVLDALEATGRQALVVGVNAIPEAIQAIRAGRLLATADFNAMQMGYTATECACRVLRGEHVPATIELPVDIVDVGNCAAWDRPYEQRSVKTLSEVTA
jgi:ribose transport system substrate-binding protein